MTARGKLDEFRGEVIKRAQNKEVARRPVCDRSAWSTCSNRPCSSRSGRQAVPRCYRERQPALPAGEVKTFSGALVEYTAMGPPRRFQLGGSHRFTSVP